MTNPPILEVIQLKKNYGDLIAVNNISFQIQEGICFGLLGPNGAGKTTTIEMIEGIIKPTKGKILYKGKPNRKLFKNETGIQFQNTVLQDFLTVGENLKLFKSLYQRSLDLDEIIELCSLKDYLHKDTRRISGGQKQRLLLALALINDPELLILDEPTVGLDPQARRKFWNLIQNIKKQNKTIVLTTHYMEEADLLCDEIVIIDKGKIIIQGHPKSLIEQHYPHQMIKIPKQAIRQETSLTEFEYQQDEHSLVIQSKSLDQTLQTLMAQDIHLDEMSIQSPNLEDLFLDLTGHHLRD